MTLTVDWCAQLLLTGVLAERCAHDACGVTWYRLKVQVHNVNVKIISLILMCQMNSNAASKGLLFTFLLLTFLLFVFSIFLSFLLLFCQQQLHGLFQF
jgi:hypothetical protein